MSSGWRTRSRAWRVALLVMMALVPPLAAEAASPSAAGTPGPVEALFADWRRFETPPGHEGAPDYRAATFERRRGELARLRGRLAALEAEAGATAARIDLALLRAEMNGFDFNLRVLQPWARDPAFYATVRTEQSDTPAHEGPNAHGLVELWTYAFPLTPPDEARLTGDLRPIPAFLAQARGNLTGTGRDLWTTGIGTMRGQADALAELERTVAQAGPELRGAVAAARRATESFVAWLDGQAPSKTGPSGVGKESYTWSQQHVHLLPLTWDDEVAILRRELARAHAALKLEEERNRALPPLTPAPDDAEFQRRADRAIRKLVSFLGERKLYPMRDTMDAELRRRRGAFVPIEQRNFFAIATHYEPLTLYTHSTHWWELARLRDEPQADPIRQGPLLYNIWDGRSEGMATAMEELLLHAGLFDDQPRAREIVWIMLAQRAARGLASLYLQANEFDLAQAKAFQVEWTPRGWMRPDLDLLGFEQQLYLRQPGYGTSYITGKVQLEDLLRERAHQLAGIIPVSLIRWQLTGDDREVRAIAGGAGAAGELVPCSYWPPSEGTDTVERCARRGADGGFTVVPEALRPDRFGDNGLAEVTIGDGLYWVDRGGRTAQAFVFDNGTDFFEEGLARTVRNGKLGFVNERLEVVIEPVWDFAAPFSGGLAQVCRGCSRRPLGDHPDEEHFEMAGGKWGTIDRTGKVVVPVEHDRDRVP
jgi:hypothetical protein